jgi:hypothetical protein
MSPIRQTVELDGMLVQGALSVPCRVRAMRISVSELGLDAFVKTEVIETEADLPNGVYELCFEGRSFRIMKADGVWSKTYQHAMV